MAFQKLTITPDMIAAAPERPTVSRGRRKGTAMDRELRDWYENETADPFGGTFDNSAYGSLQTAVARLENRDADKPRKSDYLETLGRLGLSEVFLGQTGQSTERVQTLAIVRVATESDEG